MSSKTSMQKDKHEQDPGDLFSGNANDALTGHQYDGIQEYDNPLPGWWKWLFIGTIVFSFPYYAYYHFGGTGRSVADQYMIAEADNARKQLAGLGEIKPDRETLVRFTASGGGALAVGRSVYLANCVACHGPTGGGLVGPNLTDEHYKNVRNIEDILKVVNNGAAAGAMPAWLNRLEEPERILVSAYVASLRGQDPGPGAKAPEGNVIAAWPEPTEPAEAPAADAPATEGLPASPGAGGEAKPDQEVTPADPQAPVGDEVAAANGG